MSFKEIEKYRNELNVEESRIANLEQIDGEERIYNEKLQEDIQREKESIEKLEAYVSKKI